VSFKDNKAGRLILKGGASSGLGFAIRFGARFLFLFVAGRLYGAALFGAFSIANALVEAAIIAGGLSTKWMLFKWLNQGRDEGRRPPLHIVYDAALLVLGASTLVALAITAAVLLAPEPALGENTESAALVMAAMIPLQALIELLLGATRWTETMRYEVVAKNVMQPYGSIIVALAAYWIGWREEGLYLSYVAGTLASLFYSVAGARRCFGGLQLHGYRPQRRELAAKLREVAPTTGTELTDALYTRLDIYVVGLLLGEQAAGLYGMAKQISMPIRQVRQAFDGMLVPVIARTLAEAGATASGGPIGAAARLILLIQLPFLILLAGAGLPLLGLIGPAFPEAFGALLCLAAAEAIQGTFGLSELVLIFLHPRWAVALTGAFAAFGLAAALLLQRPFGLTGIALAVLLGYAGRAAVRRRLIGRRFSIRIPVTFWAGPVLAGTAGGLAAWFIAWSGGRRPDVAFGAAAAVTGLAAFGLILYGWIRLAKPRLVPEGFRSAPGDQPSL
jgi:O-antigen/teichoic acid export membrane protein